MLHTYRMTEFVGTWKLETSDNFEAYMKEIGIHWPVRKMVNATFKPTITISISGNNHFVIRQESAVSPATVMEFNLDEEFEEKTADGRFCQSICTLSADGKLVQIQKGKVRSVLTRYVEGDMLITECEANGVMCVRKYRRQAP